MGWILETNKAMNRAMEGMGGRVVRRFRIYGKDLDGSGEPALAAAAADRRDDV